MKKLILFTLVFLCLQTVFGDKPKVAVMLEDRTKKLSSVIEGEEYQMGNMFSKRAKGKFTTVTLDQKQKNVVRQMQKETQSMEKSKQGWIDFGNQNSAQYLFYAVITSFGNNEFSVSARLIDLKNGEYVASDPVDFEGDQKAHKNLREALKKVIEDLISQSDTLAATAELEWSQRSKRGMDYAVAKQYCDKLDEGGHKDWRLPNIDELRTLIKNCPKTETGGKCKVSEKNGCLSWEDCGNGYREGSCECDERKKNNSGYYSKLSDPGNVSLWSSSSSDEWFHCHWSVDFNDGAVIPDGGGITKVRCVRTSGTK